MAQKLDADIAAKRRQLKELNDAIAERTTYHKQQEKLIAEMVEAGNTELMGLTHDIKVAKHALRECKTDVRTAAEDKVRLNEDLDNIRGEIKSAGGFAPAFS